MKAINYCKKEHVSLDDVPEYFRTDDVEQPGLQARQRCNTTAHEIQVKTTHATHASKSLFVDAQVAVIDFSISMTCI